MIRDCEMLNTIRNTVQMGQIGIESVIPEAEDARFCAVLRQNTMKSARKPMGC